MAYLFYRAITIDHTQVPGTDQTNFPVLIAGTYSWLATVGNGGDVTSSSGYDIVFSSDAAGTTPLAFERVVWDATTGAVEFWVKVPSVSHTVDTVVYIRYGDSAVTTEQGTPASVWDANFKSVHHYGTPSSLSVADSTSNARSVTANSATATTGKIGGGAATLDGSAKKIQYSDTGLPSGAGTRTIEAWFNASTIGLGAIWAYGTSGVNGQTCALRFTSSSNLQIVGWGADANLGGSYSTGTWYHAAVVYDGSAVSLYLNGAITSINATALSWSTVLNGSFYVGSQSWAGDCFSGTIDEVRVSNVVRSADWIAASYANQSNPATFYTIGAAIPITVWSIDAAGGCTWLLPPTASNWSAGGQASILWALRAEAGWSPSGQAGCQWALSSGANLTGWSPGGLASCEWELTVTPPITWTVNAVGECEWILAQPAYEPECRIGDGIPPETRETNYCF